MDWNNIVKVAQTTLVAVGLQVLGAIALYIIGRWLIGFAVRLLQKALTRQHIEATLLHCKGSREKAASMLDISMATLYRKIEPKSRK